MAFYPIKAQLHCSDLQLTVKKLKRLIDESEIDWIQSEKFFILSCCQRSNTLASKRDHCQSSQQFINVKPIGMISVCHSVSIYVYKTLKESSAFCPIETRAFYCNIRTIPPHNIWLSTVWIWLFRKSLVECVDNFRFYTNRSNLSRVTSVPV